MFNQNLHVVSWSQTNALAVTFSTPSHDVTIRFLDLSSLFCLVLAVHWSIPALCASLPSRLPIGYRFTLILIDCLHPGVPQVQTGTYFHHLNHPTPSWVVRLSPFSTQLLQSVKKKKAAECFAYIRLQKHQSNRWALFITAAVVKFNMSVLCSQSWLQEKSAHFFIKLLKSLYDVGQVLKVME